MIGMSSSSSSATYSSTTKRRRGRKGRGGTAAGGTATTAGADATGSKSEDDLDNTFHYEFGGPIGSFCTMLFLPLVVMLLMYWSELGYVTFDGIIFPNNNITTTASTTTDDESSSSSMLTTIKSLVSSLVSSIFESPVLCPSCTTVVDTTEVSSSSLLPFLSIQSLPLLVYCMLGLTCWFIFQVLLERFLPYELIDGTYIQNDPTNGKLKYRINGHLAFWITLLVAQIGYPYIYYYHETSGYLQFTNFPLHKLLFENYSELAFSSFILCTMLSFYLYYSSFQLDPMTGNAKILAVGGNSGNHVYDFWIGRELNPRTLNGTFDWKVFCELRPGLILWMLLNISCLYQQQQNLGYVTGSMILVNLFQGIYVWDALYQEKSILSTMDVTTDGFGFMLIFGDMCWVPFTYSIQAKYLVHHDPHLTIWTLCYIVCLYCVGFMIFRGANGQKDAFRRNPNHSSVKHLQYMETKRGTKLLTSGYWGMARKINYTGDYIMGLTWCLLCGFDSIVPYYYAIYFAILLVHRSIRDDQMCYEKYGDDWIEYKKKVPYRFIPGII